MGEGRILAVCLLGALEKMASRRVRVGVGDKEAEKVDPLGNPGCLVGPAAGGTCGMGARSWIDFLNCRIDAIMAGCAGITGAAHSLSSPIKLAELTTPD